MNIAKKLICVIMLWSSLTIMGQDVCLIKCLDYSGKIPQIHDYNVRMDRLLTQYLGCDFVLRFIAKPSISPEYAFQMSYHDDSTPIISVIILNENFWSMQNQDSVQVRLNEKTIDKGLAHALDSLFELLTNFESQNRVVKSVEGGDDYNFIYKTNAYRNCVEAWLPCNGSLLNEIIDTCLDCMWYSLGKEQNVLYLQERISKISEALSNNDN